MPTVDITAIMIANIMGITILASVAKGGYWCLKKPTKENRILIIMLCICLVSCIVDPIGFILDGKGGALNAVLLTICNSWIYLANLSMAYLFHLLMTTHLGYRVGKLHRSLLSIMVSILWSLLIVNIFVPIVFSIEGNVYSRTDLYWAYLAVEAVIILDAMVIYLYVRRTSGKLKLFPAASFLTPAVIGVLIQSIYYGVSTMHPFFAISLGSVVTALQNEFAFKDQLTGLYNRSFFTTMEKKLQKAKNKDYIAMMLDINSFKSINDTYGHNTGDRAIIETANILLDVIGENGTVIRYAGDEFIIILYDVSDANANATIAKINSAFDSFNKTSGNPYRLSVSIGYCRVSLKDQSMNSLVDRIDRLMYQNKRKNAAIAEPPATEPCDMA